MYTPKNIRRARGSQRAQRTRDRKLPRTGPKLTLEAERPGSGETEQYHGYRCNRSSGRYHALTIRTRRARAPNAAYGPNITSNGSGTNRNYQNPSHAPVPSPSGRPPACVLAEVARDARARGMRARSGSGTSRCSMLTWIEWKSTGALQTRTATRTSPRPSSRPRDTSTSAGGSPRQENAHVHTLCRTPTGRQRDTGPSVRLGGRERERERAAKIRRILSPTTKCSRERKRPSSFKHYCVSLSCVTLSLSLSLPRTRRRRGGRERGNEAVNGSARHSPCGSSSLFPHFSPARMCLIANNVLIRRRTRRRAGSCVTHTHRFEVFIPGTPSRPGRTLGPSPGRSGRQPSGDPHVDAPPSEGRRRVGVRRARELGRIDRVAGVLRVQIIRGGTCSGAFLSCVHPRNNYMYLC